MPTKKKKLTRSPRRIAFSIFIIAVALAMVGVLTFLSYKTINRLESESRVTRIVAIYDSLRLDDTYKLHDEAVFGDKRVYSYDKSRTYSSSREYQRGATVSATMDELAKAALAAGFTALEEPYPGSLIQERHFKSDKNEYLRITVSSKPRDDALRNSSLMTGELSDAALSVDANSGPSNVVIKVNLDDNNE